jgi:phosphatidylserine/phosphatidylglycerophosphate/cardiolipin synthase-like enzyme
MRPPLVFALTLLLLPATAPDARAAHRLCDPGLEDCRAILVDLIRKETVGIDAGFWFMEDPTFSSELIRRWRAGVPVRILMDTRANAGTPLNATRLAELAAAGIPMRERYVGMILHWKMMLFAGQNAVEFSGANFSWSAWAPMTGTPLENFIDESIFFTDKPSIVNSFKTKFDDLWLNTDVFRDYANITAAPTRRYARYARDPELNFPPEESYADRAAAAYNLETQGIDAVMYRITDIRHTRALIAARLRGIPVRLITEQDQYRPPITLWQREWYMWHAAHVDLLSMFGVQIRHRGHQGLIHQKSVILRGQGLSIFGSSNWTEQSSEMQEEHNLFTRDPEIHRWFRDQFERKWANSGSLPETMPFTPQPPERPASPSPANLATGIAAAPGLTLGWDPGFWGQLYDLHMGLSANALVPVGQNMYLGPGAGKQVTLPFALPPGTTIYWKVVSRTLANLASSGDVWSFTTAGTPPPPPPNATAGAGDIVLYAAEAQVRSGAWTVVLDGTAASGRRLSHPDAGAAKLAAALADPAHYFEMTFHAEAGVPYRLWLRARADLDGWTNDSVFVQFSKALTPTGAAAWRIGTASATEVVLEDCNGCGLSGWGWQDNGWGVGMLGPLVYFETTGPQTIRIQTREDGVSIDQILLSRDRFLNTAPGSLKNDGTIFRKQ